LEYIRDEAYLTEDQEIHVTGAGCDIHKDLIEKTLGRKSCFIDEFFSQGRGCWFLLKNLSEEELFHPWVHLHDSHLSYKLIADISTPIAVKDISEGELKSDNKYFPHLFVFLGSAACIIPMYEDRRPTMPLFTGIGGKCFLGLSRMLLGTGNYTEITELANRGSNKCDTCLLDVTNKSLKSTPDSAETGNPYLHPFGKLCDDEETEFNKEDTALSVVHMISMMLAHAVVNASSKTHIRRIIFGGNMGRAEIFRISILQAFSSMQALDSMEVLFLKTGHTGAIGSMISSPDEVKETMFGPSKKK